MLKLMALCRKRIFDFVSELINRKVEEWVQNNSLSTEEVYIL